jgi:hypothetical protein
MPYHSSTSSSSLKFRSPPSTIKESPYQWAMGDPGDDLRAPGDSDNNGGQKDGDSVGDHISSTGRKERPWGHSRPPKR